MLLCLHLYSIQPWLYFVLIISKWELHVQLSSASLLLAEDNTLVHELRFTTAVAVLLRYT